MKKISFYFSMIVILLANLLLLYVFYLAFYPFIPVELNKDPFVVVNKKVVAGENVQIILDFTKNMDVKPEITYYLVDGSVVELRRAGISRPVGRQITMAELKIPKGTASNTYHLQVDLIYKVNLFQTKYYSWESQEFNVISQDEDCC